MPSRRTGPTSGWARSAISAGLRSITRALAFRAALTRLARLATVLLTLGMVLRCASITQQHRSSTILVVAYERITSDPHRMGGLPCIRDLRVTVGMVLGQLAGGATVDQVLDNYPYLKREDVAAALEYAAAAVNEREVQLSRPA